MATAVQSITVSQDFPDEIVVAARAPEIASLLGESSIQIGNLRPDVYAAIRTSDRVQRRHLHRRLTKSIVRSLRARVRQSQAARELGWIASHRREYAGQWVALVGDRLLAHGNTGREVFAAVAQLVERPLVIKIDEEEQRAFGGW